MKLIDRFYLKTIIEIMETCKDSLEHKVETAIELNQRTNETKIKYLLTF